VTNSSSAQSEHNAHATGPCTLFPPLLGIAEGSGWQSATSTVAVQRPRRRPIRDGDAGLGVTRPERARGLVGINQDRNVFILVADYVRQQPRERALSCSATQGTDTNWPNTTESRHTDAQVIRGHIRHSRTRTVTVKRCQRHPERV
jgi:hypothetical protein